MSRLFELAFAMLRRGSPGSRAPEPRGEPGDIDPKYLPDVMEGLAQARRHRFAPEAEIEADLRRFEE
jgi:hypothetical protein